MLQYYDFRFLLLLLRYWDVKLANGNPLPGVESWVDEHKLRRLIDWHDMNHQDDAL
jgi:hypothetical protein